MALAFINKQANRRTFSGKAAIWISADSGATWTKLSKSSELTITPETSESEIVDNRGHGNFDDVTKNYIIEGKFIERGEDVRQLWTNDTDQGIRGNIYAVWIQGSSLVNTSDAAVTEHWAFYQARLKRNHQAYALGSGDPMFTFTFYCSANDTCADVTITAPTGDDCYSGAADATATVSDGEFHYTFDSIPA